MNYSLFFFLIPIFCFAQNDTCIEKKLHKTTILNKQNNVSNYFFDTIDLKKNKNIKYINYTIKDSAVFNSNNVIDLCFLNTKSTIYILNNKRGFTANYINQPSVQIHFRCFESYYEFGYYFREDEGAKNQKLIDKVGLLLQNKKQQKKITIKIFIEKLQEPTSIINGE